ncbi:hypothetical protein ACFWVC_01770 [Streptomyces sp. NPDC058691]|uniref:hypothetical protein n=1 Tax=Streptomyces sp. NPDC058691 TaxID=3346601 RepID=UPI003650692C
MAKLAASSASSRLSLSDPKRSALDVSWTCSLRSAPGSDALAARMSHAALEILACGTAGARISQAVLVACGYVVTHGQARRFRVTLGVEDGHCSVCVTDTGYDQPPALAGAAPPEPPSSSETTRLCRQLTDAGDAEPLDGVQVHHTADGAVLVRFRARLPEPGGTPRPHRPPPDAPDHSRGPGTRG